MWTEQTQKVGSNETHKVVDVIVSCLSESPVPFSICWPKVTRHSQLLGTRIRSCLYG